MPISALLAFSVPAGSAVPGAFRPNAGTILNIYAPPADALALPSSALPIPSDDITNVAAPGASTVVHSFDLEGVTLLPHAEVQAQLADLIDKKVTLQDLRKAAARVTSLFHRHGYFLARAYVPAQNIDGGRIRISVLEGRYDLIEVRGSTRLDGTEVDKTLLVQGVASGKPIVRMPLERSLILLEQRMGAPASAVLEPGSSLGTSTLHVDVPQSQLINVQLGADNFGSRYTGEQRGVASVQLNSPLGIGDAGEMWAAYSTGALGLFASYRVPVGHRGLTLGVTHADYHYELCCEFRALDREGDATVNGINARYPLLLSQRSLLNAGINLQEKHLTDTWGEGDLADRRVTAATFALDGISAVRRGQVRYQFAFTRGDLELNGSPDLVAINEATIDTAGRYSKLWAQAEISQPVSGSGSLYLRLSGQVASRNLDSSEKFLLGGYNGVRAYPEGEAAGDEAMLARLEWITSLPSSSLPGKAAIRAFVDSGTVWIVDNLRNGLADPGIPNHYWLSGAGVGFNWNMPRGLSLSAYVATKIGNNPGRSAEGNDADGENSAIRGWLGMEWAF